MNVWKKTRIPSVDGGNYPVWEGPVYCQQVLIWKYELMSSFVESGGGVVGAVGLPSVNNIHYFLIKELSTLFDNIHIVKPDLVPKLCLWTFINLTFFHFKVLCKRTVDTYWETGYRRLCFFLLDNAITGSKCLKPANICQIVQGIYTPSKNFHYFWCAGWPN